TAYHPRGARRATVAAVWAGARRVASASRAATVAACATTACRRASVIELAGSTPAGGAARYAAAVSGRSAGRSAAGGKRNGSGSAAGVAKRSRKTVRPGSATDRPSTLAGASASATRLSVLGQSHGSSTAALPTAFPGTCLSFGDGGGVWVVGR